MKKLKTKKHIMLDLETLSLKDNPVVLSMSAVCFDIDANSKREDFTRPSSGIFNDKVFNVALEIDSQIKKGLSLDSETLKFHLLHNEAFFKECIGVSKGIPIIDTSHTLNRFHYWYTKKISRDQDTPIVWANGAIADFTWLRSLYTTYGMEFPISYKNQLCLRTITSSYESKRERFNNHDSFDDCVDQILTIQELYKIASV